jgi:hypothetical protein
MAAKRAAKRAAKLWCRAAQWLATYPASAIKGQMEYSIEPAEQTNEVKAQLAAITPESLNPEELTLIDPACGSGHVLVEAYELFKAIEARQREQQVILERQLDGVATPVPYKPVPFKIVELKLQRPLCSDFDDF